MVLYVLIHSPSKLAGGAIEYLKARQSAVCHPDVETPNLHVFVLPCGPGPRLDGVGSRVKPILEIVNLWYVIFGPEIVVSILEIRGFWLVGDVPAWLGCFDLPPNGLAS